MPQTLQDLQQQFGGRWYDFGASEQRHGAQGPGGWMRAPRIDPMAEAVWHPQYGWQRWKDVKGGDYGGLTQQFGDPYEIFGYKQSGDKAHGLYRPGSGGGAPPSPDGLPPGVTPLPTDVSGQEGAKYKTALPGQGQEPPPGLSNPYLGLGMQAQMGSFGQPSRFNYGGGYGVQGRQPYQYPGGGF